MEYYKLTIREKNKQPKEEYFLDRKEAEFLKGFYRADNVTAEITTLNTDQQSQQ